jgi:hypothetical protein
VLTVPSATLPAPSRIAPTQQSEAELPTSLHLVAYGPHVSRIAPGRHPSLHRYPDITLFCFGCQRGGSIFDFAAQLWLSRTKGREFLTVRDRVATEVSLVVR